METTIITTIFVGFAVLKWQTFRNLLNFCAVIKAFLASEVHLKNVSNNINVKSISFNFIFSVGFHPFRLYIKHILTRIFVMLTTFEARL